MLFLIVEAKTPTLKPLKRIHLHTKMDCVSAVGNERATSCYKDVVPTTNTNYKARASRQDPCRESMKESKSMGELLTPDFGTDEDVPCADSLNYYITEAAIRNAMNMASQCSLQSIGSYEPFDPVDPSTPSMFRECSFQSIESLYEPFDPAEPTTWNEKSEKNSRRFSSPMVSCYCYVGEDQMVDIQKQEKDTALLKVTAQKKKEDSTRRRFSAPVSSPYTLEQRDDALYRRQTIEKIKTDTKKERISRQRSHSPTTTSHDKDDKKDRRARRTRRRSSSEQQENVDQKREDGQKMATDKKTRSRRRRSSAPTPTPLVTDKKTRSRRRRSSTSTTYTPQALEEQETADPKREEKKEAKTDRKKERSSDHRSRSPIEGRKEMRSSRPPRPLLVRSVSAYALGKQGIPDDEEGNAGKTRRKRKNSLRLTKTV